MANPWNNDPIVIPAGRQSRPVANFFDQADAPSPVANFFDQADAPWANDPVVQAAPPADTFGRRIGLGVRDVLEGVAGPLYNLAGMPLRAAGMDVKPLGENLDALGLPKAETPNEHMTSAIAQPVAGVMTGMGVGQAMGTAGNAIVRGVGNTLTQQPGTQAVAAGVGGAVTEATDSPWAGLAASIATPLAGAGIGRVISPNILASSPERAGLRALAEREVIPLTLAQQTGGRVARNFEATLGQLPGSSGVQAERNATQQTAWDSAAMRRMGSNADNVGPDALRAGRANLGATFDDLSARNTLQADQQATTGLQTIARDVMRYVPPSERGPIVARIEDAVNGLQSGSMPGEAYRTMDSTLGEAIRSSTQGHDRLYLGRLRDTLRDAMDRSISPEDQAAWQEVRSQYAAYAQIAKAMNRPSEGTAMGHLSPAALAQATVNGPSKSFALGRGNMDDLARLGQAVLKQTVPDSGTSQRTNMANMIQGRSLGGALVGGAAVNPLLALAPVAEVGLPYMAARAYHSNAMRNYLTSSRVSGITPNPNRMLTLGIGEQSASDRLRDR